MRELSGRSLKAKTATTAPIAGDSFGAYMLPSTSSWVDDMPPGWPSSPTLKPSSCYSSLVELSYSPLAECSYRSASSQLQQQLQQSWPGSCIGGSSGAWGGCSGGSSGALLPAGRNEGGGAGGGARDAPLPWKSWENAVLAAFIAMLLLQLLTATHFGFSIGWL